METAITVALVAAAVTLFSVFANYRLNIWQEKRRERIQASKILISVFYEALELLKDRNNDPAIILVDAFFSHKAAVDEFGRHLPCFTRKAFFNAWRKYAYVGKEHDGHDLIYMYFAVTKGADERKQIQKLAIDRLKHLLSFAKHA